jgi:ribosomal protein S18 acetylase RimI-like enzyme
MPSIDIIEADLYRPQHQRAVADLTNAYAMDPMGAGKALAPAVREDLLAGLREHPTTLIFLAYDGDRPVGIATCFRGFSTFMARPLINIHDLAVLPEYRGQAVGRRLLEGVEAKARQLGCCKVTLEVQENNHRARSVYAAAGFGRVEYAAAAGGALFLAKALD